MVGLTEKPEDMTKYEWEVYQDLRDRYFHRMSKIGGRWTGSPWELWMPHQRAACNRLVKKGYFTVDEAMYYHIRESEVSET